MDHSSLAYLMNNFAIKDENGLPHTDKKIREAAMALRESAVAQEIVAHERVRQQRDASRYDVV